MLVCGGRDYADDRRVRDVLDEIHKERRVSLLIQGGADGADWHALMWARVAVVPFESYRADWDKYGKAAGPIRNARMLAEGKPDLVVAFPGGRGTEDMKRRARAAGVPVKEVAP